MIVILAIALFLILGSNSLKPNRAYYIWSLLILFFITALRYPALGGTDNIQYAYQFNDIPTLGSILNYKDSEFTIGFLAFMSFTKTIVDHYMFFQIVYTAFTLYLLHLVIKKLNLSPSERCLFLFGFFCYKFLWFFWGTLRQNIADLFFWYFIIIYYQERLLLSRFKKCILLFSIIAVPTLFHSSAIINLVFFTAMLMIPDNMKIKVRRNLVIVLSILIYLTSSYVFSFLVGGMINYVDARYEMYADAEGGGANFVNFLFRLLFFILLCNRYDKIEYKYKKFVLDAMTMMVLIGSINQQLVMRVQEYYAIGLYITMAVLWKSYSTNIRKRYQKIFYLGMLIILVRFLLVSDDGLNTNYYFYWQKPEKIEMSDTRYFNL